ncbi:MAG: bis(5'-nucleosyl)-tetraphosphatase (symmetrical) YqeK [Elusimicrobia bacterium]|nr:bis(5'-nucleosyl)-tetraphosphatase (symmetrical) YqeK [Elusimicrobiota bacterium]
MTRKPSRSVLLFGGAFDPVHNGHIRLLSAARQRINPDVTLVVPTCDEPAHKPPTLFPAEQRLALLKAALKKTEIAFWDFEIRKQRPAYTWETLAAAKRRWPGSRFYLLIGSDNVKDIPRWRHPQKILNDALLTLVIGRRPGIPVKSLPGRAIVLRGIFPAVSSRLIRKLLLEPGKRSRAAAMIPKAVRPLLDDWPGRKALVNAYIKERLPESRYRHSLAVAKLAVELSAIHGINPDKAELAALGHDASRVHERFRNLHEAVAHGRRSAALIRRLLALKDKDVLEAICGHTVGIPGMGRLAQLIYVADLAGYDRAFSQAEHVRRIARKDLREACREAVAVKFRYLIDDRQKIYPGSTLFWNSLI